MAIPVEKWQAGDMSAFEALFQRYKWLVFKTAILMVGSKEEAEDIRQDVFVSIWNSRNNFNPEKGKFVTWLHRITINRCISGYRRKQPASLQLDEATLSLPDVINRDLPEEGLIKQVEYERLIKAIDHLDSKHRSAVVLRFFNDLSYIEIAEVLDIPVGTVKSRIHNAVGSLREKMSPAMPDTSTDEGRNL